MCHISCMPITLSCRQEGTDVYIKTSVYFLYNNECTKVQNPRYKDVTLNAYTSAYEQKLSLESIII